MKKYIILLLSVYATLVNAQDLFSGTIYYKEATENIPLEGANIYWLGTDTGAVTNQKGMFSIPFSTKTKKLVISYIGFRKIWRYIIYFMKILLEIWMK